MNFSTSFIELEQKIEHLVARHTKLKETNDALRREVSFLRQENQRLQREQDEIEERLRRIIERVQNQENEPEAKGSSFGEGENKSSSNAYSDSGDEDVPDKNYR